MSAVFYLRRPCAALPAATTVVSAAAVRVLALFACAATLALGSPAQAAEAAADFSAAERALFLSDHLHGIAPPAKLQYRFHKSGGLETGFDDQVSIVLEADASGRCCRGSAEFLSGEHQLRLPVIEQAQGNPVLLYFLEHDVREMQRLTQGQPAHFRKRIRMAIFNDAQLRETRFDYQGRSIAGSEVRITPYLDDPARHRFARFADKEYVFMLADEVPGGIYGIRTRIPAASDAEALVVEELFIDGAQPARAATSIVSLSPEPSR